MWCWKKVFLSLIFLTILSTQPNACVLNGPRYRLTSDTVRWSLALSGSESCVRGVRFSNVVFDKLTVVSAPQTGRITLQGSGFSYEAASDFHEHDFFSLMVSGTTNKVPGSSTIEVVVTVYHANELSRLPEVIPPFSHVHPVPPSQAGSATSSSPPPQSVNDLCGSSNGVAASSAPTNAPCSALLSTAGAAEKPGPSATLFAAPFYYCIRNFFVATNGNDANPGTQAQPWVTIQHADTSYRTGGDCINVMPGLYQQNILVQHGGTSPTPEGYVVYRCQVLDSCHVLAPDSRPIWGFKSGRNSGPNSTGGNFVVVDGFEIDGNNALQAEGTSVICFNTADATYGTGNSAHHLWIINNVVHHCNQSGIQLNDKEWYYSIHNTVYHNSFTSQYQGSGISYVGIQCIEGGTALCYSGSAYVPTGMDITYAPPFHNVVAWNNVYYNMIDPSNPVGCGNHTDGNGIIMDSFLDSTAKIHFPFQTLVLGNLSYLNGGSGIRSFRAYNITIANNSVYGNGTDTCISAFALGDLSSQNAQNDLWINNISVSVMTSMNSRCQYCGGRNSPLVAAGGAGATPSLNNTYSNNITNGGHYDGNGIVLFDNDVSYFSCSNNPCSTDPNFSNPAPTYPTPSGNNFALLFGSRAIGAITSNPALPSWLGDAGACDHTITLCP
jgi:hypothetical protein